MDGNIALGYRAELLPKVCNVYLQAQQEGNLLKSQEHIAERCLILLNGLATVGIIALVDEATGFQEERDKLALQAILDRYLLHQFAAWAKRFPDDFYKQIFRLRRWEWKGMKVNRPQCVAAYTKELVYSRLAPRILEELEARKPARRQRQPQGETPPVSYGRYWSSSSCPTPLRRHWPHACGERLGPVDTHGQRRLSQSATSGTCLQTLRLISPASTTVFPLIFLHFL